MNHKLSFSPCSVQFPILHCNGFTSCIEHELSGLMNTHFPYGFPSSLISFGLNNIVLNFSTASRYLCSTSFSSILRNSAIFFRSPLARHPEPCLQQWPHLLQTCPNLRTSLRGVFRLIVIVSIVLCHLYL